MFLIASAQAADCKKKFNGKAATAFKICYEAAVLDPSNHKLETEDLTQKILSHSCRRQTRAWAENIVAQHRCFVRGQPYGTDDARETIKFSLMGKIDEMRSRKVAE